MGKNIATIHSSNFFSVKPSKFPCNDNILLVISHRVSLLVSLPSWLKVGLLESGDPTSLAHTR